VQIIYRSRQFWRAIIARPDPDDIARAHAILPPELMALFLRMHPSEQAHCMWIFRQLIERGEMNEDLLMAALLHDVGKSRHPLNLWERVVVVLGRAFFPERVKDWGQAEARGWRRPFVVAEQHASWGAEMVSRAGASPMMVSLIRRHQESFDRVLEKQTPIQRGSMSCASLEDQLLNSLQLLDGES
jgi:putative nucleotidyltransferase with HDIG domain